MDRSEGHHYQRKLLIVSDEALYFNKENLASNIDENMVHQKTEIGGNNFSAASQLKFVTEGKWL